MTGPVSVSGSPHELFAEGGIGATCASMIHDTVEPSSGGNENAAGKIVYVYTQSEEPPLLSAYVHV